ncbi:ligand-binding domain of nuclear hormone receptor domain-containing protein [Ditylenchus destructor]|uniref:Ligand-binding domain of nuclear hormone receptor domain-containing protein n=1 Tax=Ditylenchus destructor TaxID=166010 RepID=A0AAD4R1X3_9BILA|nr:ligand-binding domain of nuclear hormone receptor domain-containing protein [Ditylenchus destructor]
MVATMQSMDHNKVADLSMNGNICAICEDDSHGIHFGVNVCRACAAFFRRSTISSRNYQCRFGGGCPIGKGHCRACRLEKCKKMGMDPSGVQRHRDHIGPRKSNVGPHDNLKGHGNSRRSLGAAKMVSPKFSSEMSPIEKNLIKSSPHSIFSSNGSPEFHPNALNLTNLTSPGSLFSSNIYSPLNGLHLLNNIRRNLEEQTEDGSLKSYATLTPATVARPGIMSVVQSESGPENLAISPLKRIDHSGTRSNGSSSSGFCSASSSMGSQQQSPSSPPPSCSSYNSNQPYAGTLLDWSSVNSTSSVCQPEQSTSAFTVISGGNSNKSTFGTFGPLQTQMTQQPSTSTFIDPKSILSRQPTIPGMASCSLQQNDPNVTGQTPLIAEMLRGYKKFNCLRKTAVNLRNCENGGALHRLFDETLELVEGSYTDHVTSLKNDLSLISEMVNDHFLPLSNFSVESKWSLLRNFFCPFVMSERTHSSMKNFPDPNDMRFMISARHYSNLNNLSAFFNVKENKSDPGRMAEIMGPIFQKLFNYLQKPFREMNITEEELVGYMGICFWNERIDGLSDNEIRLAEQTQDTLHNELYLVCRRAAGGNLAQGGVRFATLCNMVTITHKLARDLAVSFSLANVTNLFEIDTFLHDCNPHSF